MKRCSKCGEEKSLDDFPKRSGAALGVKSACKSCHNASNRAARAADPGTKRCASPRIVALDEEKRCVTCGEVKSLTEFYARKEARDGRCSSCRECQRASALARARKDPAKHRKNARRHYWSDPQAARANAAAYRVANRSAVLARSRDWAERNREYLIEYRRANKEALKANAHRRRARLAVVQVERITDEQFRQRFEVFGNRCAYCGACGQLTIDHVKPIVLGGPHILSNIRPACGRCNSSKGAKPLTEWLRAQARAA